MKHRTIGINRIWRRVASVLLCAFLMPGICGCGEFEPLPSPIIEEPIAGPGSEETDAAGKDTAGSGTAAEDGEGLPVDGTGVCLLPQVIIGIMDLEEQKVKF